MSIVSDEKGTGPLPVPTGNVWKDLDAMHKQFGFSPMQGKKIDRKHLKHRLNFLSEELTETYDALATGDSANVIDGLIDLIVVAVGTLDLLGVRGPEAWIQVMNANMAKEVGTKESRPDSDGMDLIKPEGWVAPDMSIFVTKILSDIMHEPDPPNFTKTFKHHTTQSTHELIEAAIPKERVSITVLEECAEVMRAKSADYASTGSSVMPADYYPNGAHDFIYMIDVLKRNRQNSLLDMANNGIPVNNESLEDTLKDRINYLALFIEWLRRETPGQKPNRDIFNQPYTMGGAVSEEKS